MSDKQLRELDAWIDVNIFDGGKFVGLKKRGYWWRPNSCGYTASEHEAGRYTREEAALKAHPDGEPVTIHEFEPRRYTSDSAASMDLLKKCAEWVETIGNNIELSLYEKGKWKVGAFDVDMEFHCVEAPTLELAIALFAQKLYSK